MLCVIQSCGTYAKCTHTFYTALVIAKLIQQPRGGVSLLLQIVWD